MPADHHIPLACPFKFLDGITVKKCVNSHGDSFDTLNVGFHSKLRLPIKDALPMFHVDPERQAKEITVNLRIKPLGDVLFFLIRLREDQLPSRNKLLDESPQVCQPIN